jgi:phosphoribosyl-AMP cyclohydrolase
MSATATAPNFDKTPLIPVIAQDAATGDVLMLAYMNAEAYAETLNTRRVCYFSRSRNKLWRKGEESGNIQELKGLFYDCDADTLLVKVHQIGGAACHEGYRSCFFREIDPATGNVTVIGERVFDPKAVYKGTCRLLNTREIDERASARHHQWLNKNSREFTSDHNRSSSPRRASGLRVMWASAAKISGGLG